MKKLLVFFSFFPLLTFGQQHYTLSGEITDAETGEDLIGVTVLVVEPGKGIATNSYGFYSLSLPAGTYTIRYSCIGYEKKEQVLNLNKNHVLNIE
ncbi:MAG: carboxypeptidase-like regulatory domain-containing protein, partial [Bacteroidales bacterium]|nr:carboxypeptidase-like regulatory domain-containing protein [Bacteroidales bacterium]